MKKSIATIALFTLALITTSFTTATSQSLSNMESTAQDPPIGGVFTGGGGGPKKQDVYASATSSNASSTQTNSFNTDKQSLGSTKKID